MGVAFIPGLRGWLVGLDQPKQPLVAGASFPLVAPPHNLHSKTWRQRHFKNRGLSCKAISIFSKVFPSFVRQ